MKCGPLLLILSTLLFSSISTHADQFTVLDGSGQIGKEPKSYQAAEPNTPYPLNWWARTAQRESLRVALDAKNVFRLLPGSEVQITGSGAAGPRFRRVLKLQGGSLEADLPDLGGGRLEVETPTAICGAVGTRFSVNALTGEFNVTQGGIFARAKADATFEAINVSGYFKLQPGRENAFVNTRLNGNFRINGQTHSANNLSLQIAKQRGGVSTAAVEILSGALSGTPAGRYIMEGGNLLPLDAPQHALHGRYLAAASREGTLNLQRESLTASGRPVPQQLDAELQAATREASELRRQLFSRETLRNISRDQARGVTRGVNRR